MTTHYLMTAHNVRYAQLVADGLSNHYPYITFTFNQVNGSIRIYGATNHELVERMAAFARGYHAALRAHYTGPTK